MGHLASDRQRRYMDVHERQDVTRRFDDRSTPARSSRTQQRAERAVRFAFAHTKNGGKLQRRSACHAVVRT